MTEYTDDEIYQNRLTWINYLLTPEAKKGCGELDSGDGFRCCLGHGCFILNIPSVPDPSRESPHRLQYDGAVSYAPDSFAEKVGMYTSDGAFADEYGRPFDLRLTFIRNDGPLHCNVRNLATLNDDSDITPQEIGAWLKKVILGGPRTPFKAITPTSL